MEDISLNLPPDQYIEAVFKELPFIRYHWMNRFDNRDGSSFRDIFDAETGTFVLPIDGRPFEYKLLEKIKLELNEEYNNHVNNVHEFLQK